MKNFYLNKNIPLPIFEHERKLKDRKSQKSSKIWNGVNNKNAIKLKPNVILVIINK